MFRGAQEELVAAPVPERPREAQPAARDRSVAMLAMQAAVGNAVTSRFVAGLQRSGMAPAAMLPEVEVEVGEFAGEPVTAEGHGEKPVLPEPQKSEWDEYDGEVQSEHKACAFVDGGRVGEAAVYWSGGGGNGGLGQQGLGDITLVAPIYEGAEPAAAGGQATAWIKPGTGTLTVTRSFRGVLNGANGTWWFTAAARTRIDTHERLHVAATKAAHETHIKPLEQRIAAHTSQPNARTAGSTKAEAVTALQTFIDWNTSVQAFRTEDTTKNTPGPPLGPVDSADFSSGSYVTDYGARTVGGANYAHYADVPPGPAPAPAPAPAPGP
jgi:hypothetical protein